MRTLILLISLAFLAAPAFAQKTEGDSNEAILRKLEAIQKTQEEIAERLIRIEAKLANAPQARSAPEFEAHGPGEDALAKITLPANPTKDQVREYVRDIVNASRKQNSFSDRDPQVEMLTRVGPANVDVLLDNLRGGMFGGNMSFYIMPAVKALVGNEHKEMILRRLPQEQELAEIVLAQGWTEDAKSVLIGGLLARPKYLHCDWLKAIASFKDPATYDSLKWYLANGSNPSLTYDAIKGLPGIELSKEVAECWERIKDEGQPWDIQNMAGTAMEYGHLDALEKEVELLAGGDSMRFGSEMQPRRLILRYTDARGTPEEIRKWFEENKSRLVFDKATHKFIVKKGE